MPAITQQYSTRDSILYALGVGAGIPSETGAADLNFIYGPQLQALPTMATVLGTDPLWMRETGTGIDWRQVVHGEQFLRIHKPLPAEARIVGRSRVDEVYDKGAGKSAVLFYSIRICDAVDESLYATVTVGAFIRGAGGFGGSTASPPEPHPVPEERLPDLTVVLQTRPEQAAIYRLSGDYNPMHIDPKAAAEAGFQKPILHGLCSYGVAGRAILHSLCAGDAARLRVLNVRFTGLVYPGDTLVTDIWKQESGRAAFRVRVAERGIVALNNGYAEYLE